MVTWRYMVNERKRPSRFRKHYSRAYTSYNGESYEVALDIAMLRKKKHPDRYVSIERYVYYDEYTIPLDPIEV